MAEDVKDDTESNGKGGKRKLIIIIVAVLLVLLIAGGAAFFFLGGSDAESGDDAAVEGADSALATPAIYYNLEPAFVVDFNIAGKQRYVQLDVTVMSRSQEQIDAVRLHMPLIRNSLVLLFSSEDFEELRTMDGKQLLKISALEAINSILTQETGEGGIENVLFTNFVMQ